MLRYTACALARASRTSVIDDSTESRLHEMYRGKMHLPVGWSKRQGVSISTAVLRPHNYKKHLDATAGNVHSQVGGVRGNGGVPVTRREMCIAYCHTTERHTRRSKTSGRE